MQQHGRLDIAGQVMTIRIAGYVIAFCISLVITHNMMLQLLYSDKQFLGLV